MHEFFLLMAAAQGSQLDGNRSVTNVTPQVEALQAISDMDADKLRGKVQMANDWYPWMNCVNNCGGKQPREI